MKKKLFIKPEIEVIESEYVQIICQSSQSTTILNMENEDW